MGSTAEHQALVKKILLRFGSLSYVRMWPNNTGKVFAHGRKISFGLTGSADILGILANGTYLAIEVKTGKAKQNADQIAFAKMIHNFKGIYILARSEKDVYDALTQWQQVHL